MSQRQTRIRPRRGPRDQRSLFAFLDPERVIQKQILEAIQHVPGVKVWRASTGVARSMDGKRVLRFGIAGQADLTGILPGGQRLEIEVKTATGRQSPFQRDFQAMIENSGGVYVLARSLDDALRGIRSAMAKRIEELGGGKRE